MSERQGLGEVQRSEHIDQCNISRADRQCGGRMSLCSARSDAVGAIEGYRCGTYYSITECPSCGVSTVSPREIDGKIYETIYEHVTQVPGYAKYAFLADKILKETDPFNYIASVEGSYFAICETVAKTVVCNTDEEILEVGCGQGYLTYALRKAGYDAIGLDLSEQAVRLARQRYGDFYFCGQFAEYIERTRVNPRLIVASELVEHLTDPIAFISEALGCLAPGGALVLTTPNKVQPAGAERTIWWDTELPPVHLWWFTKRSFTAIAERLGCQVTFSDFTKFYKHHYRFEPTQIQPFPQPILDQDYGVRQLQTPPARPKFANEMVKRLVPNSIVQKARLYTTMRKRRRRDDSSSTTICAVFKT